MTIEHVDSKDGDVISNERFERKRVAKERTPNVTLRDASRDLKQRIIDQKNRLDMPIMPSLGELKIDSDKANGHNDDNDDE
jgi:hypothetical protein